MPNKCRISFVDFIAYVRHDFVLNAIVVPSLECASVWIGQAIMICAVVVGAWLKHISLTIKTIVAFVAIVVIWGVLG